jgi:hypothetical protein
MNRDRRSSSNDPTDEPAIVQSTQSASGLSAGRRSPGAAGTQKDSALETVNRRYGNMTPRRYEQPLEDDDTPPLRADGSSSGS